MRIILLTIITIYYYLSVSKANVFILQEFLKEWMDEHVNFLSIYHYIYIYHGLTFCTKRDYSMWTLNHDIFYAASYRRKLSPTVGRRCLLLSSYLPHIQYL